MNLKDPSGISFGLMPSSDQAIATRVSKNAVKVEYKSTY
jgi:hypothetical protein